MVMGQKQPPRRPAMPPPTEIERTKESYFDSRLLLYRQHTARRNSSATTIDATHENAVVRSKEGCVSVCADCPARFFDASRSSTEHRIKPWQQHTNRTAQRRGDSCGWRSGWSAARRCDHRGWSDSAMFMPGRQRTVCLSMRCRHAESSLTHKDVSVHESSGHAEKF